MNKGRGGLMNKGPASAPDSAGPSPVTLTRERRGAFAGYPGPNHRDPTRRASLGVHAYASAQLRRV
jgi:hypothetical protein